MLGSARAVPSFIFHSSFCLSLTGGVDKVMVMIMVII